MQARSLRFGRFELQPQERRLLLDGKPAALGARAFDVLLHLASRAGLLVSKAELLDTVWAGLVVEEANLAVQVSGLRKVLGGDVIATIPGRGYRFTAVLEPDVAAPVVASTPPALAAPPVPSTPLPLHDLVGRDADLQQLAAGLATPGCLTLTGTAGVGKTSLARVVAGQWPEGAVWVDLAPVGRDTPLAPELARALGVEAGPGADGLAALARQVGARLLVLDNAEHLIDACAALAAALLQAAPALHLLATSQLPLAVPGERVHRVEPLSVDVGLHGEQPGALGLLIRRIQDADRRFSVTAANQPVLREICRRLDGLPLALEMAAARVPVLGLVAVRDALDQRFALLTRGHRGAPGRHRTLLAAVEWSHALLAPREQALLHACSLFVGGFTLDLLLAALAPAADARWGLIDDLSTLVDRSLVSTDRQDPPRYRLLESVRSYALAQPVPAAQMAAWRGGLATALLALFRQADDLEAGEATQLRARAEHDNVLDAIVWARQHDPALAVRLAVLTARVATYTPWRREAMGWLESCADVVDAAVVLPQDRGDWWRERARQWMFNRSTKARAMAQKALEVLEPVGDDLGTFITLATIVQSPPEPGEDMEPVLARMEALLERHPEWSVLRKRMLLSVRARHCMRNGDREGTLHWHRLELETLRHRPQQEQDTVSGNIAHTLVMLRRFDEAVPITQALLQRMDDATASANLAYACFAHLQALLGLGRLAEAREAMPRGLAATRRHGLPILGDSCARLVALEGDVRTAALLLGHAQAEYARHDMELEQDEGSDAQLVRTRALLHMDEATFQGLLDAGRAWDTASADHAFLGAATR